MNTSLHTYLEGDSFKSFSIKDQSVNLVVTSPPYPMVEMWDEIFSQYDTSIASALTQYKPRIAFEKMHLLLDGTWKESFRVLRPGGFLCINIGDATRTIDGHFQLYSNHSRILYACHEIGFDVLPCIIWRKPTNAPNKFMGSGMLPAGAYVTLEHEMILILRKGGKRIFTKAEKEIRGESTMFWEERNIWFSDQWTDITGTRQKMQIDSLRKRSGAFPIDLPLRLIHMYSQYNDVVLDPFSGTGTTALAAMVTGRNSINIDSDTKLLNASAKLPTKHSTKKELNELICGRFSRHMDYVKSKDILFFKYRNEAMGIPVKTLQEKKLVINTINTISNKKGTIKVSYSKFNKAPLSDQEINEDTITQKATLF